MTKYFAFLLTLFLINFKINAQKIDSLRFSSIPHGLFWENTPKSFSIKDDQVVIVASGKTDMFRDPNVTYNTDRSAL